MFNPRLYLLLWLSFILLLFIFLVTDYIGKYYVAREQTFNSRIVSHLADSLINFNLIKTYGQENHKLKELEQLIELDTYFRIRRQLWLKYSSRILLGFILIFGIGIYFIQIYWPFINFNSLTSVASTGIILAFFMRVLFATARSGIFFEAFRLGLILSTPNFQYSLSKIVENEPSWKTLTKLKRLVICK